MMANDIRKWRDDLMKARLSGVRVLVDQSGERIEYKSDSEMRSAIAAADAALSARRPHTILLHTSKGV
ncbi:phage head-tail joining protein [Aurantimonas coralicida]|uniref:phage head-tail joining protein n=1 Tax=Aurantimonas coralicida TaxID=182270 RepID=UPI0023A017BE|nr:hypothetical protein [Aurantimonas coralicida]MDE0921805.1 hypothetical protein [Aurantimonas coralicida]